MGDGDFRQILSLSSSQPLIGEKSEIQAMIIYYIC